MSESSSASLPRDEQASTSIELVIEAKARDLGGFVVRRALPSMHRRRVGPFTFFDHMGPIALPPGEGMDVRPHPHIALATVTFLFEGEIDHRDSLGTFQTIRPGDVNWMLAGRGIVHSERSPIESRKRGVKMHGIQSWVALPTEREEDSPSFQHHPAATIPSCSIGGVSIDVIAGTAFGEKSPVEVLSPTLYVHAYFAAEGSLRIDREHEERAVYVVEGQARIDQRAFGAGSLMVLREGVEVEVEADSNTRLMLLGGAKLSGERLLWWNFVSSSAERLERAKDDWKHDRFEKVPGDDERIPLPEK
ncbi:MAG: pirin family protein [Polyangiaceae bacterium]